MQAPMQLSYMQSIKMQYWCMIYAYMTCNCIQASEHQAVLEETRISIQELIDEQQEQNDKSIDDIKQLKDENKLLLAPKQDLTYQLHNTLKSNLLHNDSDLTLDVQTLNILGERMSIPAQMNVGKINGSMVFVPPIMDRNNYKSNGMNLGNINGLLHRKHWNVRQQEIYYWINIL